MGDLLFKLTFSFTPSIFVRLMDILLMDERADAILTVQFQLQEQQQRVNNIPMFRAILSQHFCTYSKIKESLMKSTAFEEPVVSAVGEFLKQSYNNSGPKLRKEGQEIQWRLYQYLMGHQQTSRLVSSLFQLRKFFLVSQKTAGLIREYLEPRFQSELTEYQRQFLSYYYLILRDPCFFDRVQEPKEKEELILYQYSALMSGREERIRGGQIGADWDTEIGTFGKEALELKCYFNQDFQPDGKNISSYTKRSKLEQEVELILRNLKIPFLREQPLRCYKVDFLIDSSKVLQVLGPSHFIPGTQILKGDQQVRKRVIEKSSMGYQTISHFEWSRLKGLQEQRQFVDRKLRDTKK